MRILKAFVCTLVVFCVQTAIAQFPQPQVLPPVRFTNILMNDGDDELLTLATGDLAANRTVTIPEAGANSSMVLSTTGNVFFTGPTAGDNTYTLPTSGSTLLSDANGVSLQAATPGTAQTGNLNISATAIVGTLKDAVLVHTPGAGTIGNGDPIPSSNSFVRVVGSQAASVAGTITDGTVAGQILIVEGLDDALTVQIDDSAGNVQLGGDVSAVLGANDTIQLIWDGTNWVEISRSNN